MKSAYKSVIGMCRKNNEDYIFAGNEKFSNLFIVADGMGGCNAGEIASSLAVQSFVYELSNNIDIFNNDEYLLDLLVSAVRKSNDIVHLKSWEINEFSGMGTTIDAVVIRNNKLLGIHIGDSRVYLFRDNKLMQITEDHSFVADLVKLGVINEFEAEHHPNKNLITRALGTRYVIDVDTIKLDLLKNDIILLCTDGLNTMISDNEIKEVLTMNNSIYEKVDILIDRANNAGGVDNISLILIELNDEEVIE